MCCSPASLQVQDPILVAQHTTWSSPLGLRDADSHDDGDPLTHPWSNSIGPRQQKHNNGLHQRKRLTSGSAVLDGHVNDTVPPPDQPCLSGRPRGVIDCHVRPPVVAYLPIVLGQPYPAGSIHAGLHPRRWLLSVSKPPFRVARQPPTPPNAF